MKTKTKYITLQVLGSTAVVFIIIITFFILALEYEYPNTVSSDLYSNKVANNYVLFELFVIKIPLIIGAIISGYTLSLLRKRKKEKKFSRLSKKEIILLTMPIWFFILFFLLSDILQWLFSPYNAEAVTITDVSISNDPFCCPRPLPTKFYEILDIVSWYPTAAALIFIFAPWFSFLGYLRKKHTGNRQKIRG